MPRQETFSSGGQGDVVEREKKDYVDQNENQENRLKADGQQHAGGLVGELQADLRATADSVDAVLKLYMRATELVDEI